MAVIINNSNDRAHVNKYAEQNKLEQEEREKSRIPIRTPGATDELKYIQSHIYSADEIKNFNMSDAIDESILSSKPGAVRSKLAYKFIMDNKNITSKYLLPGKICMFYYNDPKTKGSLDYWDTTPLVLFFGIFRTNEGNIREIGLNLHYYPPFARKKIVNRVYEMFKSYFDKAFNQPNNDNNNFISYRTLKRIISSDAKIAFGVREYVPSLRGITYVLPTKYIPIAYYTEGHFSNSTQKAVQQFWRKF